jgi:hypothetical protein
MTRLGSLAPTSAMPARTISQWLSPRGVSDNMNTWPGRRSVELPRTQINGLAIE